MEINTGFNYFQNEFSNPGKIYLIPPELIACDNYMPDAYIQGPLLAHPSELQPEPGFWETVSTTVGNYYNRFKNAVVSFFSPGTPDVNLPEIKPVTGLVTTRHRDVNGAPVRLNPEAAACFEKLMDITARNGIQVKVTSSHRSVETQKVLYARAVKKYGSESAARKWVAPPGKSQHNYGNALDIHLYKNGRKLSQDQFDQVIGMAGFYRPMSYEGWHIEPVSTASRRREITSQHKH